MKTIIMRIVRLVEDEAYRQTDWVSVWVSDLIAWIKMCAHKHQHQQYETKRNEWIIDTIRTVLYLNFFPFYLSLFLSFLERKAERMIKHMYIVHTYIYYVNILLLNGNVWMQFHVWISICSENSSAHLDSCNDRIIGIKLVSMQENGVNGHMRRKGTNRKCASNVAQQKIKQVKFRNSQSGVRIVGWENMISIWQELAWNMKSLGFFVQKIWHKHQFK